MDKQTLIRTLQLEPHREGGWFRRSYCSSHQTEVGMCGLRPLMSSIFYMLSDDSPTGHLHRNRSDIMHYFHHGGPLQYDVVYPDGRLQQTVLGMAAGQALQLLVPGGCWKASRLLEGEYGLISEAVCPGFVYEDMELAQAEYIKNTYPALWPILKEVVYESA